MARHAPAVPVNVPFYARVTKGERAAISAILAKKTQAAQEKAPGSVLTEVGWFRDLVAREAAAEGIAIVEPPTAPEPPTPASPKGTKKTAKKSARAK